MKGNFLEIGDLYLAIFIKAKYHLRIGDMKKVGGRVIFCFDTGGLNGQELIQSFYNGNDGVSANEFVKELKDMKALVHNL